MVVGLDPCCLNGRIDDHIIMQCNMSKKCFLERDLFA